MVKRSGNQWVFELIRPRASEVFLAGDFNGWSPHATPMRLNSAGLWQCELTLPPGVYRFRYRADGQWLTDYAAFGVQRNPLGDFDSVLLVEEQSRIVTPVAKIDQVHPQPAAWRTGRHRFRNRPAAIDVPSVASRRHVALVASRQRRLASAPPVGIERVVEPSSKTEQLAGV
ncbi:MAG: isoamylase early set domain-containing protein [Phycisphaerales bacterium]